VHRCADVEVAGWRLWLNLHRRHEAVGCAKTFCDRGDCIILMVCLQVMIAPRLHLNEGTETPLTGTAEATRERATLHLMLLGTQDISKVVKSRVAQCCPLQFCVFWGGE